MELIFADATKIQTQSVQETGGKLEIKVINIAPVQLRELFTDPVKTKIMRITEREQNIAEYEGYTEFYRTEEYTGGIYGVVINQVGKSSEERIKQLETSAFPSGKIESPPYIHIHVQHLHNLCLRVFMHTFQKLCRPPLIMNNVNAF